MLFLIFTNLLLLLIPFILLWLVSIRLKDASIVDIMWGPACALPALFTYMRTTGTEPRATLLLILVGLWALRLGLYLGQRNIGHGEDYRYQAMRKAAGSDAAFARISLIRVFVLQAFIAWFVSLPTQIGQLGGQAALGLLAMMGTALFAIGLVFEAVGDWQLRQFKNKPENKGKLMTEGLWAWTRHPNYFGDACVWAGLTLIALESSHGWLTLFSPAVMIFFLYAVSGKALLEKAMVKKYPEYAAYKKRVSGFFPLPPKRNHSAGA